MAQYLRNGKVWTDVEVSELRKYYLEMKLTPLHIGRIMDRSDYGVKLRILMLAISEAIDASDSGVEETAIKYGIDLNVFKRRLAKFRRDPKHIKTANVGYYWYHSPRTIAELDEMRIKTKGLVDKEEESKVKAREAKKAEKAKEAKKSKDRRPKKTMDSHPSPIRD